MMVIGLVFVHFGNFPDETLDPFMGVVNAKHFVPSSLNSFFTYFFLCSVPVLSLISGYLFTYRGVDPYPVVLRKKFKTLLAPYLTWTTLWMVAAFVLYSIGKANNQFTYYDQGFSEFDIGFMLDRIVGMHDAPFAFQFWFVHDLMLSILISPLLIYAIRKLGFIVVLLPFIGWIAEVQPLGFFYFKVPAFFMIGLYCGLNGVQPKIPVNLTKFNLLIPVFIALILVRIYLPNYYGGVMPYETLFELVLRVLGSVAIVTIALNMRLYLRSVYQFFVNRSGYAFFLHAAHFPLVIIVKQILYMTGLFKGDAGLFALWVVTIVSTVAIVMLSASLLHKVFPRIYRFMNGQRAI